MGLADEYRRQAEWRAWGTALDALPPLDGASVLDLGCGVGDLAALLVERGARVHGIEANAELLEHARARGLPGVELAAGDLREELRAPQVDGIWASFVAAYFVELAPAVARWSRRLKPGGWMALIEVDDLFAHEPLGERTRDLLEAYVDEACDAGRYDFRMGRRLAEHASRAGLVVEREVELPDRELAFSGPAEPAVLAAWAARLERMTLLHERCGAEWAGVRDDLLACLSRADHTAGTRVRMCIARSPA